MPLIIVLVFIIVTAALIITSVVFGTLRAARSSRQDPPGLGPAQLLPPTVQWQRSWWVSTAITETNSLMYLGLAVVGMLITLTVAVTLILRGSAGPLGVFFFGPMGLVLLLLQGGLFVKGMLDWQKNQTLTDRGQLARGVLIDRWKRRGHQTRLYCVAYYFEPLESRGVVRAEINFTAYDTLRIGDVVQVRYLPDQPQVCRLEI